MKTLYGSDRRMYEEFLNRADKRAAELIKQDGVKLIVFERIANVIVVRLRRYIRNMDEKEVYELVSKEMPSLRRLKAADKHLIAANVIEYMI